LFGHVQRIEENRNSKKILYTNLETTRLRVDLEIYGKMKWGMMED